MVEALANEFIARGARPHQRKLVLFNVVVSIVCSLFRVSYGLPHQKLPFDFDNSFFNPLCLPKGDQFNSFINFY